MTQHSHQTAPTQFVDASGIRFAYRRFGKSGGVPLVFNMHFTGTMDHWDPMGNDGLAATRGPEHGDPDAGSATDLRRHLQGAGGAVAEGPLHRVGSQPSCRPRIPEA